MRRLQDLPVQGRDRSRCSCGQLAGAAGTLPAGIGPSRIGSSLWRSRMGDRRLGQRSLRGSSHMVQEGAPPSDCSTALAPPGRRSHPTPPQEACRRRSSRPLSRGWGRQLELAARNSIWHGRGRPRASISGVALQPDRSTATMAKWLSDHPHYGSRQPRPMRALCSSRASGRTACPAGRRSVPPCAESEARYREAAEPVTSTAETRDLATSAGFPAATELTAGEPRAQQGRPSSRLAGPLC